MISQSTLLASDKKENHVIPVLCLADPRAGCVHLQTYFGFQPHGNGVMAFGDARILVVAVGDTPDGFIPLSFDHVAFNVASVDDCASKIADQGGVLDVRFTPDGPRGISEFWTNGVRFVFFQGPEGCAFEFCAKNDPDTDRRDGHSHFAIRTKEWQSAKLHLLGLGATPVASHTLAGQPQPVHVEFMQRGDTVFEIFDEAPIDALADGVGWVGLVDC